MCVIAGAIIGPSLFDNGRQWLCTLLASLCISSCVVSLLSVGAISVNRYVYICRHAAYRRLFSRGACFAIVAATWVVGVALDLPCHIGWSAHTFDRKTQKCLWDRTLSHHYTLFYVTVGMLLPLVIIVLCYWRIFAHIRRAKLRILHASRGGCGCLGMWTTQAAIVKTIRQIRVIFIIFVTFCICWAPYAVVLLSDEYDMFPLSVHLFASMIAHLHASVNFFIYGLANKSLRAGYRDFLHRLFGLCCAATDVIKPTYSPGKEDVFTDPDYDRHGRHQTNLLAGQRRRFHGSGLRPPGAAKAAVTSTTAEHSGQAGGTQAKQEDRQISHVSGNERVDEQDPQ